MEMPPLWTPRAGRPAARRDHQRGRQRLKGTLRAQAPKTVNNVLTVLSTPLKTAVEWDVVDRVPCMIRMLKVPKPAPVFHDFEVYEHLVEAARTTDPQTHLIILLGGEAGVLRHRSTRTWRCEGRRHGQSKNWPGTPTSRRHSATCI